MDKGLLILYSVGIVVTVATSFCFYYLFSRFKAKISLILLCVLILSSVYMLFAQWFKYLSLHFYIDFSHWLIVLHNITLSGKPLNMAQELFYPGTMNYLSAHFVPLVYALAVPFNMFPYSQTIIFLNFILMASAVIPLYKLALARTHNAKFSLFAISLLLWYPTFQYTVLYEFEMLRFSIPIIFWMLYFHDTNKKVPYFCFVILAILVREEVGLAVGLFGVYLIIFEKKYIKGLITALAGFTGFLLITQIFMPGLRVSVNHSHVASEFYAGLGNNFGEVFMNMFRNPGLFLHRALGPFKLMNIFMYFLPLLFVPLLRPAVLISIIANLIIVALSSFFNHCSYMMYYLSPVVPFIFYAFIQSWPRFIKLLSLAKSKGKSTLEEAGMAMVLSTMIVANVFFGPSPVSLQFWFKNLRPAPFKTQDFHYTVYQVTEHSKYAFKMAGFIPDEAIVSAQHFLFTPLYKKKGIMIFPKTTSLDGKIAADYVFFDKTNNGLKEESPAYRSQAEFEAIESDKQKWELIAFQDGLSIFKRIR